MMIVYCVWTCWFTLCIEKSVTHEEGSLSWLVSNLVKVCCCCCLYRHHHEDVDKLMITTCNRIGKKKCHTSCVPTRSVPSTRKSIVSVSMVVNGTRWKKCFKYVYIFWLPIASMLYLVMMHQWHWLWTTDRSALTMLSLVTLNCTRPVKPISVSRTNSSSAPYVLFLGKSLKSIVDHPLLHSSGGRCRDPCEWYKVVSLT